MLIALLVVVSACPVDPAAVREGTAPEVELVVPAKLPSTAKPVTAAELKEFFRGGVTWSDGTSHKYEMRSDGKGTPVAVWTLKDEDAVDTMRCDPPRAWELVKNTFRLKCDFVRRRSSAKEGSPVRLMGSESYTATWRPLFAARDRLIYREEKKVIVVDGCSDARKVECFERECVAKESFAVQLLPGNRDRKLLDALEAELWSGKGDVPRHLLFEGAPAKVPRETSEIFYAEGFEEAAGRAGEWVAPVLGTIKPALWPGPTPDFPVIVVVGKSKKP